MPEELEPMWDKLAEFARLYLTSRDLEAVAREMNITIRTAQNYRSLVEKYINRAAELLARGVPEEEVKSGLNVPDELIKEAKVRAFELTRAKQEEKGGKREGEGAVGEVERLKAEAEEARSRVQAAIREAAGSTVVEERPRVDVELLTRIDSMINTLREIERRIGIARGGPVVHSQPVQSQPAVPQDVIATLSKIESELSKIKEELKRPRYGWVRRKTIKTPDGTVRIYEKDYEPKDKIVLMTLKSKIESQKKQMDIVSEKILPEALNELKGIRSDLRSFGERLLGILESQIIPRIPRIHPALSSTVPVTFRTPEQREAELRELSSRLGVKVEEAGGGER